MQPLCNRFYSNLGKTVSLWTLVCAHGHCHAGTCLGSLVSVKRKVVQHFKPFSYVAIRVCDGHVSLECCKDKENALNFRIVYNSNLSVLMSRTILEIRI